MFEGVEVFAGAGFFTLALSRAFGRVTAIESDPDAASDLRLNLEVAGRSNVTVLADRLEALLPELSAGEVLVLDPHRAGLPPGCIERLARLDPARVVYLSCDPATLARDLAAFVACGYRVDQVTVFDLFPQTPHVETLVCLVRGRGPSGSGLVHSAASAG